MRHKYETRGIILSRAPVGESSAFLTILTPEIGLVRALAQSVRRSGAKLGPSLATFAESDLVLVRGRDSWRVAGAVLAENWFARLGSAEPRTRAGRVSNLILRLVAGEERENAIFPIISGFFKALATLPEKMHESVETLAVIRLLSALGLDSGDIPGNASDFTEPILAEVTQARGSYIARINHGIDASGL